jgi:hypothetical protein
MADVDAGAPLPADEAERLVDFARACKAAARAVVLYPGGHPAIGATLGRIAQLTARERLPRPLTLTVVPGRLLVDGQAPARPDASIGELASLLHDHLIGELTVHPGGDTEAWRQFLLLLARPTDAVRAEGGISRVWMTMGGRHVEIREIDYGQVLRDRRTGGSAEWEDIVASCLQGMAPPLTEETIRALLEAAGDPEQLAQLVATIEERAVSSGLPIESRAAALLRLMRGVVDAATAGKHDVEPVLYNLANAIGGLSPEMMAQILSHRAPEDAEAPLVDAMVGRMSDGTVARLVARGVTGGTPTDRLAQVFQTLVRDGEERVRLLALARSEAATFGSSEGFDGVWDQVAQELLTSYSDRPFVSDEYARELTAARTKAVQVEEVSDDPPERITGWVNTVATSALRALDLTLVLDLLRLEEEPAHWADLMPPVVSLVEDLLMVGDFESAAALLEVLTREAGPQQSKDRRQHAMIALDGLVEGSMMRHIVSHLSTIDEAQFERVKAMCVSIGEVLVRPLAEVLSSEGRGRTRERLTAILLAFGATGRRTVERLKGSANAAVRRTAVHLLREFGGKDALPDLADLLDDTEPQVQREAVRAILDIGTERAYRVLEQALAGGTSTSREAIMQSLSAVRDERATPMLAYILGHVDHRGPLAGIYLRAIELLGAQRDPEAVPPLREALYRGEWWAPRRTAALRSAAAAALARIGTPEAFAALEQAAREGSRGVRAAARTQAAAVRRQARSREAIR